MIELVIVYCLIGEPKQCDEQRPQFEQPLTALSCMMNAEFAAAGYLRAHPSFQLSSWRCEKDKPREDPA